jgi:Tat protein translocase TatB subunit
MNFFNIGAPELLLIFIIALIVFGPRRLPELAKNLGKIMNDLRKMSQEFTTQMAQELNAPVEELKDIKQEIEAPVKELAKITQDINASVKQPGQIEQQMEAPAEELREIAREVSAPAKEGEKAVPNEQLPVTDDYPPKDHLINNG